MATVRSVVSVRALNVGELVVAISWIVLMVPLPLSVKLVLLNCAIPFCVVLALSIVMVPAEPLEFARVKIPV